ncbi:MAG: SDR family oxidoreductase [Pseudomonadota bacterium]
MKISNSTILITGANRGIGLALVEQALAKGADQIYATYRSLENRARLEQFGQRVKPLHLDLSDRDTIAQLAHAVPTLDILINNAGLFSAADLLEDTEAQLRSDFETNFFGALAVTKTVLPALKSGTPAAVANVSSISGLASMPSFGGYSASKAAVHSMTQALRAKLKADSITVHGVYPGPVATRMTEGFEMETTPPDVVAKAMLDGIENGVEEIFPDAMSQQVGPVYLAAPKKLEQAFSEF